MKLNILQPLKMKRLIISKSAKKRILKWAGFGLLGMLIVLFIAFLLLINTVLSPKKITPILLDASKEFIRGEVDCESIDITFFSVFPDMGIRMKNGSISSGTDTLLSFEKFVATIHPLALLFQKQILIHQLEIENADIYVHINKQGHVNWDIFASPDSVKAAADTSIFVMPELDINNIRLINVHFTFNDVQHDVFVMVDSLNMRLKGNLSKERSKLSFGMRTPVITTQYEGQTLTRSLPFSLRTDLLRDQKQQSLTIEKGTIKVGTVELDMQGILKQDSVAGIADIDVDFSLNPSSLADLVGMIPERISGFSSKLIAGGKVESNGKLSGCFGKDVYPLVTLSFQLTDGTLASAPNPKKPFIDAINLDFQASIDPNGTQPSSMKLSNLYLQTASSKLTVKGEIDNLLAKPEIKAQTKANINFTQMSQKLPIEGVEMTGQIDFDIAAQCLLEDILAMNYGKINANGVANIRDVKFRHEAEQIFFYTSNAGMTLGINTKDSLSERFPESLLRCRIVLDTLHLNRKDELVANSSRLSMLIATSEPKDSVSIAPMTIRSRISGIRFVMGDSLRIRGVQAAGGINIQPRAELPNLPEINGSMTIDTLMGRTGEMSGRISMATFKFNLTKQPLRQRNSLLRNIAVRDTVPEEVSASQSSETVSDYWRLTQVQRDSLRQARTDRTTHLTFQIESEETKDLLRSWELTGGFTSNEISIRTPYFPLQIRMIEPDMSFNDNILNLANAHIHIGQSDFTMKGDVEGIRRALLYNGTIAVKMTLDADSLDVNELIRTAVAGSEYAEKNSLEKDSILKVVLDDNAPIVAVEDSVISGVFVVPRNLDIEFNSQIENCKFSNLNIQNANGRIILRDQTIRLPRFSLNTNIGSATMTMLYKAPDPKGAYLGLDLSMKQIDLKELVDALPFFVEMAPMINSFEGVVDCDMTAITELDSLMNVRLPATTASCNLSGKNLVLLDGETFAEISKTLMFKNKNKNIIDSMSVEMILEEEKLMIFPFLLSIDRYNVAVGGMQHLDMSFDYHITVLKSPVPFKLGLNISGTPDNMKIRPGKAKYKNMFTVAREKRLEHTINLRQEMDEKLRQSIENIAGVDLSQPILRPRLEIPDSLKTSFFVLEDTTATNIVETTIIDSPPIISDTISVETIPIE